MPLPDAQSFLFTHAADSGVLPANSAAANTAALAALRVLMDAQGAVTAWLPGGVGVTYFVNAGAADSVDGLYLLGEGAVFSGIDALIANLASIGDIAAALEEWLGEP